MTSLIYRVKQLRKRKEIYYNLINAYSTDLLNGSYKLFYSNRKFIWKLTLSNNNRYAFNTNCDQLSLFRRIWLEYLRIPYINRRSENNFCGDFIIITRNFNGVKIFSHQNMLVKTVCTNKKLLEKNIRANNEWIPYFGESILVEKNSSYYVERYVSEPFEWRHNPIYIKKFYLWLYNGLIKSSRYLNRKGYISGADIVLYLQDKCHNPMMMLFLSRIKGRIGEGENIVFPKVDSHGDLVLSNVLYDGMDFYIIDFEYYCEMPFVFDIFTWIVNQAFVRNDYYPLKLFLHGTFDDFLSTIFGSYELTFNKDYRLGYIYIYMLFHLYRGFKANDINKLSEVELTCHIIKYITFLLKVEFLEKAIGKNI